MLSSGTQTPPHVRSQVGKGKSRFMATVYAQMAAGLAVSGVMSWLAAHNAMLGQALFTANGLTTVGWIVMLSPLGLAIALSTGIERIPVWAARALFLLYAILMGLSLGGLLLAFTGATIELAFGAAAIGFLVLAFVGASIRQELHGLGVFCMIGLFGLTAAMLTNLFLRSPSLDLILACVGVLIFAGLAAFDVQRLSALRGTRPQDAIIGALTLYLDLLNLFLSLIRVIRPSRR